MKNTKILQRGNVSSILKIFLNRKLITSCIKVLWSIQTRFFALQYIAVLFPKKFKFTSVDHSLDDLIPFMPSYAKIYMDFTPFWIRTQAFLLENFGKQSVVFIKEFIASINMIYRRAAMVYKKNFSTTKRPVCKDSAIVKMIHKIDPHLMCIPSLHIMVIVWTYTKMRLIMRSLSCETQYEQQLKDLRLHAVKIADSVLYLKQHSINCIAAALYTLTVIDESVVAQCEAEDFIDLLLVNSTDIDIDGVCKIRTYIKELYRSFLDQYKNNPQESWEKVLLDFLENYNSKGVI
ncbi:MAG: hypothetical protein Ta2F_03870 [Termitinemataceae bacterium]|nr:MAG: hypothetical protein Ta2F_03870 [Termitinemataceae bacterium]